jgi:hypothetical protein
MVGVLRLIHESVQDNDLAADDEREVRDLRIRCSLILLEIENAMADIRSHQDSLDEISSMKSKILYNHSAWVVSSRLAEVCDFFFFA